MSSVLITGGSKGFGRALTTVFHSRGWIVYPLVRRPEDARDLLSSFGKRCIPIEGDVTDDAVTSAIADVMAKQESPLDLLINNAGNVRKTRGLAECEAGDLVGHFQVHCAGAMTCTKAALPFLRLAQSPTVINISSRWGSMATIVGGLTGAGGLIYAYNIAKAAQNMLTVCLRQELARENIQVYAVHPGRLKTEVAAADADVDPLIAAEKLYRWLERGDEFPGDKLYDLMAGQAIEW